MGGLPGKREEKEIMNKQVNIKKTEDMIEIMGIIGILLAIRGIIGLLSNFKGLLVMGVIPIVLLSLFIKTRHPVFGIAYTILFLLTRVDMEGAPIETYLIILGLLFFYINVDYYSVIRWRHIKKNKLNNL